MKRVALGDVCDIVGGGTPSRSVEAYFSGQIPWATVRDMNCDWIEKTDLRITPEAIANSSTKIIPANSVVIATRVGLGKVCRLSADTAINQDLRGILPKATSQLDNGYLFWWLRSQADKIIAAGTGATVQGVKLPFVKSLQLPLPPLAEQRRIVATLNEAFAGIATAISNAEKNLANAREIPSAVFANSSDKNSHAVRLGDFVTRLTNGYVGPTRNIYVDTGIPYLLAKHVKDDVLSFDGKTFVTQEFNEKNKKSKLLEGDVLLVQSGHIGHSSVVPPHHAGHNCHAMIVMTTKPALSGHYLSGYLNSLQGRRATQAIRSGSTVPHLTCREVRELRIPLPCIEAQQSCVVAYQQAIERSQYLIGSYETKLRNLAELKQSLLAKAFSGELAFADQAVAA